MTYLIDIGNVLLSFDFEPALGRLLPAGCGDGPARLARVLARKDAFESGQLESAAYIAEACAQLGFAGAADEFCAAWCAIFQPVEPMWELVGQLAAAGHRLVLFSNINAIHAPHILATYPVFQIFHGAVFSYQVGAIKPHPPIYQAAIDRYQLVPEETVYIDDLAANIATGRAFGWHAYQYDHRNHRALLAWLGRLGS